MLATPFGSWNTRVRDWAGQQLELLHDSPGVIIYHTDDGTLVLSYDLAADAAARAIEALASTQPNADFGVAMIVDDLDDTSAWLYPECATR